ncbi:MAG: hypothetical protein HRU50_12400 [Winogradskyella sp.]|uniref:hypothetical protein n=1 Tax=Winogradskyella sp. TaxID=1883156 RepID=UPI0025F31465|nr:hypothetical protein [Winogradskyella sp.]NRB60726.1 hypothetical protein [Winogradskyella sp.]
MIKSSKVYAVISLLFFFCSILSYSQEQSSFLKSYTDYTEASREIIHVHLNKSAYLEGEDIGFTAYVFDKSTKQPSLSTTNLYVNLVDDTNNVVKKALLKVDNGVASNVFTIDTTLTTGNYTFKAYTNWMRNFNERNYFEEHIEIINPNDSKKPKTKVASKNFDAQFLPEGGHLLNGVINNIGVIIKDHNGYGIANVKGKVYDDNNQFITEFEVNQLGIGKFLLLAQSNTSYKIKLNKNGNIYDFKLNSIIEPIGVTLSVTSHRGKTIVALTTNKESLSYVKDKTYTLALHNGNEMKVMALTFENETSIVKVFNQSSLPSGMNIFTLFNENNKPIAERLYFNYDGIEILKTTQPIKTQFGDSLRLKFKVNDIDPKAYNNMSISVLPKETKSYNHHQNILTNTYLKSYVNGYVENARYYFTDITEDKKRDLDNLLITQGWSSYDWNNIFRGKPILSHNFEVGINVKANLSSEESKKDKSSNTLIYALDDNGFDVSEVKKGDRNHLIENLFPFDNSTVSFSKITENNKMEIPSMYLQFFPNKIPSFNTGKEQSILQTRSVSDIFSEQSYQSNVVLETNDDIQELDEVLLQSQISSTIQRQNELSNGRFGRVTVVDESMGNTYLFLSDYLRSKNIIVNEGVGEFTVRFLYSGAARGPGNNGGPTNANIFLDDLLLLDTSILNRFLMKNIDYLEINRWGMGDGIRSPYGFIRIYTKDLKVLKSNKITARSYEFPLTFTEKKQFYIPKYRYNNDDFFKHYGTIDWKPNVAVNNNGEISIVIAKPEVPFKLHIEGIANDGAFISEEKTITLN